MCTRRDFLYTLNLVTSVVYDVEGQKRQTSNLSASTQLRDYTINSAEESELHLNGGYIHGVVIALILLGCITVFTMAGNCYHTKVPKKQNTERISYKLGEKFEDSSSESRLDRKIELSPTERREAEMDGTDSKLSVKFKKGERDSCVNILGSREKGKNGTIFTRVLLFLVSRPVPSQFICNI